LEALVYGISGGPEDHPSLVREVKLVEGSSSSAAFTLAWIGFTAALL
jgi:hypothetical protein